MTPDYPSYSMDELLQAKSTIDAHLYPERYQQLCQEISAREFTTTQTPATSVKTLKPIGVAEYVLAAFGFFPFLGLPFSIIALAWGLETSRKDGKTLAFVGATGILYCVLLVLLTYIQYQNIQSQTHHLQSAQQTTVDRSKIDEVARLIELYHFRQKQYPASLKQLKQAFSNTKLSTTDNTKPTELIATQFIYQKLDNGYYLVGVGADGIAHTADDVTPAANIAKGWQPIASN